MTPKQVAAEVLNACRAAAAEVAATGIGSTVEELRAAEKAGWIARLDAPLAIAFATDPEPIVGGAGPWWTLTPLSAEALGVELWEWEDGCPIWMSTAPLLAHLKGRKRRGQTRAPIQLPKGWSKRGVDVSLGWVEQLIARREAEYQARAEVAREQLKQAEADEFLIDPRSREPVILLGQVIKRMRKKRA